MKRSIAVAVIGLMAVVALPVATFAQDVSEAEWCRLFYVMTAAVKGEGVPEDISDALYAVPLLDVEACSTTLGYISNILPGVCETTPATGGSSFGPGTWIVGSDIQPGTYRSDPVDGACLWKRLSGFGGTLDEVIAQDLVMEGPATVTISSSDEGFVADEDCGRWTRVGG